MGDHDPAIENERLVSRKNALQMAITNVRNEQKNKSELQREQEASGPGCGKAFTCIDRIHDTMRDTSQNFTAARIQ